VNLSARYGGVTRRPSPSGREERSSRTRKDDETAECTPVSGNVFSFAGGRRKRDLGQCEKPNTVCSQKELRRAARRERLQIFRGSGLATRGCTAGNRGGELTQCAGPSLDSVGPDRFQRPASLVVQGFAPLNRISSARCGWPIFSEMDIAQTQEKSDPARGSRFRCGRG
jgi:hypothetical protein